METTIKTSFNFAKEIQCNLITKNNLEHFDGTASNACIECLRNTFAYDPETCFGQAPIITEFNSFFTVSIYNY